MARLTDEEVREVLDGSWPSDAEEEGAMVHQMAAELRERRAADLTSEERISLALAREAVASLLRSRTKWPLPVNAQQVSQNQAWDAVAESLAVLDKLLGEAG